MEEDKEEIGEGEITTLAKQRIKVSEAYMRWLA